MIKLKQLLNEVGFNKRGVDDVKDLSNVTDKKLTAFADLNNFSQEAKLFYVKQGEDGYKLKKKLKRKYNKVIMHYPAGSDQQIIFVQ